MKKALKELIENAADKCEGYFKSFIFIPDGIYNGVWGKNGYDKMIILGYEVKLKMWCRITYKSTKTDVFSIIKPRGFNVHIKHELGVPEISLDRPIRIDNTLQLSQILVYGEE